MSNNKPINIIMVGPSGVGKTSLLASMYSHIREEVQGMGFTFVSGAERSVELDDRKAELKRLAESPGLRVDLNLGPKPSGEERAFDFILQVKKEIPSITFRFIDLPGAWYIGRGDFEKADSLLVESDVVVVAVDAWPLMEEKDKSGIGKYNQLINKPSVIIEALERASILHSDVPPLILFVLVKTEIYLHSGRADELFATAERCYKPLLNGLIAKKYPIAACWVETVGGLELNSVTDRDGIPWGDFRRLQGSSAGYKPKHCSVPLRLVFKIALLSLAAKTKTKPGSFWETLVEILSKPFGKTELAKNIEKYKELQVMAETLSNKLENEPFIWINKPN